MIRDSVRVTAMLPSVMQASGSVASSRWGASIWPTSAATMMAIICPHQ